MPKNQTGMDSAISKRDKAEIWICRLRKQRILNLKAMPGHLQVDENWANNSAYSLIFNENEKLITNIVFEMWKQINQYIES